MDKKKISKDYLEKIKLLEHIIKIIMIIIVQLFQIKNMIFLKRR